MQNHTVKAKALLSNLGSSPKLSILTDKIMRTFLVAQRQSIHLQMQETWVQFPGREDPLEEEIATHSSILAWEIPMDREFWLATVHRVTNTQAWLSD